MSNQPIGNRKMAAYLRDHPVKATAAVGLLGQVGRPLVSLLTLPILFARLGQEGLGVWMIALSLMGLVGFVSAGMSASVVTFIGRARGGAPEEHLHRIVTAATLIASVWAGLVIVVIVPTAMTLEWNKLLGLGGRIPAADVRFLMATLAAMLGLSLVVGVPRQVMIGRMHGYFAHLLDFVGVVVGAIGLILGLSCNAPLWMLALGFMGTSYVTIFVGGLVYLHYAHIPLFSRQQIHRETLVALGSDSLRMAGYQGSYAVSSQSDLLLIGVLLGAAASAVYGVVQRVFSLLILLSATVNYAQWPAMARSDAAGDHTQVERMLKNTLVIGSGITTTMAAFVALAFQPLIKLWLGHAIATDPLILVGMVIWVFVATLVNTCDSFLRAHQETAFLMRSMLMMAVLNISATLLLLPRIGVAGAIWGSVIGFAVALLVPYSFRIRNILQNRRTIASAGGDYVP